MKTKDLKHINDKAKHIVTYNTKKKCLAFNYYFEHAKRIRFCMKTLSLLRSPQSFYYDPPSIKQFHKMSERRPVLKIVLKEISRPVSHN